MLSRQCYQARHPTHCAWRTFGRSLHSRTQFHARIALKVNEPPRLQIACQEYSDATRLLYRALQSLRQPIR